MEEENSTALLNKVQNQHRNEQTFHYANSYTRRSNRKKIITKKESVRILQHVLEDMHTQKDGLIHQLPICRAASRFPNPLLTAGQFFLVNSKGISVKYSWK